MIIEQWHVSILEQDDSEPEVTNGGAYGFREGDTNIHIHTEFIYLLIHLLGFFNHLTPKYFLLCIYLPT